VLYVPFSALLVEQREGHLSHKKNLCHLSPEVKFHNRWRQITERELGNPGSTMGTWCMLPARYCPLAYYVVKHIKSLRLSLFGHVTRMNESTDTNRILFVQPPDNWGKTPRRPHSPWIRNVCNDLSSFGMELSEARETAQSQPSGGVNSTALCTYSGACSYWIAYT